MVNIDMSSSFLGMGDVVVGGRVVDAAVGNVEAGSADKRVLPGCAVTVDDFDANSACSVATISSASCNLLAMATICDMGGGFSYRHVSL